MSRERVDISDRATSPRPERDFVRRNIERNCFCFVWHNPCHSTCKPGETIDKRRVPYLEIVRPAPMGEVPDYLCVGIACCAQHRQETRPIVMAGCSFDQMPTQTVAHGADAMLGKHAVISLGIDVVSRCGDQIETPAVAP